MNYDAILIIAKDDDDRHSMIQSGLLEALCEATSGSIQPGAYKCLKFACVNSLDNASFIGRNYPSAIHSCFTIARDYMRNQLYDRLTLEECEDSQESDRLSRDAYHKLALDMAQFLSNFITNRSEYSPIVWLNNEKEGSMSDFLAFVIALGHRRCISICVTAVYNSLIQTSVHNQYDDMKESILNNKLVFSQILLNTLADSNTLNNATNVTIRSDDSLNEWMLILFSWILNNGHFIRVFSLFDKLYNPSAEDVIDSYYFTYEQIIMLRIITCIVEDNDLDDLSASNISDALIVIFSKIKLMTISKSTSPASRLVKDSVAIGLELISATLTCLNPDVSQIGRDVRVQIVGEGILEFCGKCLAANPIIPNSYVEESSAALVSYSLQVVGNSINQCYEGQERVREVGVLDHIILRTATDFAIPVAREWALFCLHAACDGNTANEKYLETLRKKIAESASQSANKDEDSTNIGVKFNSATGGVEFIHASRHLN